MASVIPLSNLVVHDIGLELLPLLQPDEGDLKVISKPTAMTTTGFSGIGKFIGDLKG